MKRKIFCATALVTLCMMATVIGGCSGKEDTAETTVADVAAETTATEEADAPAVTSAGEYLDEQVLDAIRNYCIVANPTLQDIVSADEYLTYWQIASSDENEIVVLFRSYTGAEVRYYTDRATGDTYVTEYVEGITPEEERTDEFFNVRDYLTIN